MKLFKTETKRQEERRERRGGAEAKGKRGT